MSGFPLYLQSEIALPVGTVLLCLLPKPASLLSQCRARV